MTFKTNKLILRATLLVGFLFTNSVFAEVTPGFNQKIPDEIMTPNKVKTRIGDLDFYDGHSAYVYRCSVFRNSNRPCR